jgi:hypothetical protein
MPKMHSTWAICAHEGGQSYNLPLGVGLPPTDTVDKEQENERPS